MYNNARGRARPPGVGRNTLEAAGYDSLDLRIARDLPLGPGKSQRELTLAADVFNLTNRVNYGSFVGTIGSPLFMGTDVGQAGPSGAAFRAVQVLMWRDRVKDPVTSKSVLLAGSSGPDIGCVANWTF